MDLLIGAQAALLLVALAGLVAQHFTCRRAVRVALQHETYALDRARATELRSSQQIDALLDRISTEPRLEVRPSTDTKAPTDDRKYISDEPYMDNAWNDFRQVTEDEAE